MKTIKKLLFVGLFPIIALTMSSCTDYQDEIDALDKRVTYLESLVKEVQDQIIALKAISDESDYITNVVTNEDGSYTLTFKKAGEITIKNGKDGEDGKAPEISVEKGEDGEWYWIINGKPLVVDGQKIKVRGKDGADAVTPLVRIDTTTGMWEISVDGGKTWTSTGTSATGKDGEPGKNGNLFFEEVSYTNKDGKEYMKIVTKSGQVFYIPLIY